MTAAKPYAYSEDVAGRELGVGDETKMPFHRRAGKVSEIEAFIIAVFIRAGLAEHSDVAFFDRQVFGVEDDQRVVGQRLQSHRHVTAAYTNR